MDDVAQQGTLSGRMPRCLTAIRVGKGFDSQRKLSKASGVDQQTISRIEAGGTMSQETAYKLAPHLSLHPDALYLTHNLTLFRRALNRGYLSRAEARGHRNYLENVMDATARTMPAEDYAECQRALDALNDVIEQLQNAVAAHAVAWPDESAVEEAIIRPTPYHSGIPIMPRSS